MRGQQKKKVWLGQSMTVLALLTASVAGAEKMQPLTPLKSIPFRCRVTQKTAP